MILLSDSGPMKTTITYSMNRYSTHSRDLIGNYICCMLCSHQGFLYSACSLVPRLLCMGSLGMRLQCVVPRPVFSDRCGREQGYSA